MESATNLKRNQSRLKVNMEFASNRFSYTGVTYGVGSSRVSRTVVFVLGSDSNALQSLAILARIISSSSVIVGLSTGLCALERSRIISLRFGVLRSQVKSGCYELAAGQRIVVPFTSIMIRVLTHALSNCSTQIKVLVIVFVLQ